MIKDQSLDRGHDFDEEQFEQAFTQAKEILVNHGITDELMNIFAQKMLLEVVCADWVWENSQSNNQGKGVLLERLGTMNKQMSDFATEHKIKPEVCETLGIKMG